MEVGNEATRDLKSVGGKILQCTRCEKGLFATGACGTEGHYLKMSFCLSLEPCKLGLKVTAG